MQDGVKKQPGADAGPSASAGEQAQPNPFEKAATESKGVEGSDSQEQAISSLHATIKSLYK